VELREIRPLDRAAVQRLGVRLFAPFGDYGPALYGWLRHSGVRAIVAVSEQDVFGFALVSAVHGEGYLLGIGVDEGHRRAGLGARLLDAAVAIARERRERWGISRLDLDVAEDNVAAIALFEGVGFARAAVRSERYLGGQSIVTMRLLLV
jgi:ribosomal protein S18 acetylase RimI-like enzyme